MKTKIFTLEDFIAGHGISPSDEALLREAAGILSMGGLLAFPTETVYGLGASALIPDAAKRIYLAKGRPSDNPLIVHIASMDDLFRVSTDIPDSALTLSESFWPGPLTMILKKSPLIPYEITGGLDTVAVRMPSHEAARRIITLAGVPVAAPSANISGRPSTTSADHCIEDLFGKIDAIVDAGPSGIGMESTIVDLTGREPTLLRPGAITLSMLKCSLNTFVGIDPAVKGPVSDNANPRAPGMKYRHYAPKAPMVLALPGADIEKRIKDFIKKNAKLYPRMALLCSKECLKNLGPLDPTVKTLVTGSRNDLGGIASAIFSCLRELDISGQDIIIAEGYKEEEIGMAIMNRLKKASGYHMI